MVYLGYIRILNGREVRIENSVTRITFRHHEACGVMPNRLSRKSEFSIRTSQPLWILFLGYSSFDNYMDALKCFIL